MLYRLYLIGLFALTTLLLIIACASDGDSEDIAENLADRLTDALAFEGGSIVQGDPPESVESEQAPQLEQVVMTGVLRLGRDFSTELVSDFQSSEQVELAIVFVRGATSYIKVPADLIERSVLLKGKLGDDAKLKDESFVLEFALQTGDGITGLYLTHDLEVLDPDAPADGDESDGDTAEREQPEPVDGDVDTGVDGDKAEAEPLDGDADPEPDGDPDGDLDIEQIQESDTSDSDTSEQEAESETAEQEPVLTWFDPDSGLTWQNPPMGTLMDQGTGGNECGSLELDGQSDWRLPTIGELRSLLRNCDATVTGGPCTLTDDCTTSGCANADCGGCGFGQCYWPDDLQGACAYYWSSSNSETVDSWVIGFEYASLTGMSQASTLVIRCVRGVMNNPDGDAGP